MIAMTWWNRPNLKDYDGIICDGAIRSGKTVSMILGFILWAMSTFNGCLFAICGNSISSVRRNVTQNLEEMLEGIFEVDEKRGDGYYEIRSADGKSNKFYLFGGKDESSYKTIQGITLAGVLLDEVTLMTRSFAEQALGRCSVEGSKYWFNCNPEGPNHWFNTEWICKASERNVLHLHFTMKDNPSMSEKKRKQYEAMFVGVFYRRYILGLWVRAEGLVYPMFDRDKHVINEPFEPNRRHRYYVSIDYGTVNPFAAGLYDYDPATQEACMVRELYYDGGTSNRVDNERYYKMLTELVGNIDIEYIIIDPSASSMIETIMAHGRWFCQRADNDVINGIQDVTTVLNLGKLKFHKSCESTFKEFESYSWKEDAEDKDTVIKENDHSMDQIRYFCRTVLNPELMLDYYGEE